MSKKKNAFNTVTPLSKIIALVLFVMFPIVAFMLGVAYQERLDRPYLNQIQSPSPNVFKACTMEAKICPDGSSVGRIGPNCEFATCPVK